MHITLKIPCEYEVYPYKKGRVLQKHFPCFKNVFDAPLHITQNIEIVQTQDLISWRFRLHCNFLTN